MIQVLFTLIHADSDFTVIDKASDRLMEVLLMDTTIVDPSIGVAMDKGTTEVEMGVDTNDPSKAVQIARTSMTVAYSLLTQPGTTPSFEETEQAVRAERVPVNA